MKHTKNKKILDQEVKRLKIGAKITIVIYIVLGMVAIFEFLTLLFNLIQALT